MLRLIITFFVSLFLFFTTSAQQLPVQWIRTFEGQGLVSDRIADITTDITGNVYVAGYAGSERGAPDAFAMKRSPQGDTLWVYYYDSGSKNEDFAKAIVVDNAGNTYITGNSKNASYLDECFTAKILPNGAEDWTERYSPGNNMRSYGNALVVDATGNVYVAGYTDPQSASNDWLVIKYNSSGIEQWSDVINGAGNGDDEALDIVIAPNGNPTVCGYVASGSTAGGINSFVKQYTPTNGTAFTDTWTHPTYTGTDKAYGLGYNTAGEFFVGGTTQNMSSSYDAFAIKYDAAGNDQWTTIYTDATTSGSELLLKVKIDDSGNIFFTGTDYVDGFTTRINADGSQGWRKKWNGPANGSDVFHGITVDNVGNTYVTGRGVFSGPNYYGNGGIPNIIITKYNTSGDSLWTYRAQDSLNSSMGFAISYHNGQLYAGGFVTDTAWVNENIYTIIIDTSGNAIDEWIYNGQGDAITMGQLVETDASNNVYCAATIDRLSGVGYDVSLVKYDPLGNLLWERYYSSYGWNNDTVTNMKFDPSGNLILSISTDSALLKTNYRLSLLKVDPQGNFLDTTWYNVNGSTVAKSMSIHTDGSIALAASSSINGGMVIFFDPSFSPAWAAKVDSAQSIVTRANSIDFLPGGDLIAAGFSSSGGSTGLVQRYTQAGAKLWTTILDSTGVFDEVRDIRVNAAGEIAFTGGTGNVVMLGKIESTAGGVIWREVYNPPTSSESGVKIRFTHAGNLAFIARGWTGFVSRYYTAQYSSTGAFQWANIYSQTASDREPLAIEIDTNNTVVTAGFAINGTTANHDYVLAGYSSTGAVEFINTYTTPTTNSFSWDQLRDLAMDNQGNFIVTGHTASEHFNTYLFDMLTIKYGLATPVGLEEMNVAERNMAIAFPNPSTDGKFTLLDASPHKIISARIFDSLGRFIKFVEQGKEEINLRSQRAGLYVLVLERETGTQEILKLVVM